MNIYTIMKYNFKQMHESSIHEILHLKKYLLPESTANAFGANIALILAPSKTVYTCVGSLKLKANILRRPWSAQYILRPTHSNAKLSQLTPRKNNNYELVIRNNYY